MTIHEAITRIDSLKFNTYTNHDKIAWLSRADWNVKHHILDKYECTEVNTFEGYTDNTDIHTKLLVPPPYDELYLRWLEAQIDYYNAEYEGYNTSILMYNTDLEAYADHIRKTHKPKSAGRFLF